MSEVIKAYPLQWPDGWQRTHPAARAHGRFTKQERRYYTQTPGSYLQKTDLSIFDGIERVQLELQRLGIDSDDIVISSNVPLKLNGLPRSSQPELQDTGVAVYWINTSGKRQVMAIDRYYRVADNLAAVAATLEAMRAIDRHGGAMIMERAFTGFVALPSPEQWWHVLGFETMNVSVDEIQEAYQKLAAQHHPDREHGDNDTMARINAARDEALRAVRP